MPSILQRLLPFGVMVFFSLHAWSSEAPKPPKKSGDKKAVEMDYGPCLAVTVGITKDNIAYKGLLISLNKERTQNVLFDTELLRVTAAWTGGYLNWASRAFANDNNDYCTADGDIQFSTSRLPGWSKNGERDDPRNPKDGPLPADWAKYKGLYLNGDKVVVSYTVGPVPILESYTADGSTFIRQLEIGASQQPLELFLMEGEDAPKPFAYEGHLSAVVELNTVKMTTWAGVDGAPANTRFEKQAVAGIPARARVYLKIPAHEQTLRFNIAIDRRASDRPAESKDFSAKADLSALTHGGPARWTQTVETKGVLAKDDAPYVVDTLTAPEDNPYKSWLRFTGLDFFSDGRAAVCTWNGDVWIVSGIDDTLEHLHWKRFATGLNNPMGVKIVDGVIHTIGRDQITKLTDLNGDGEADFYENINNDCFLTTNFHEMCFDLQTDAEGNFYFAKGSSIWAGEQRMTPHHGTLMKVSKDGSKLEVLCHGLRAPNGIAVGPHGELTVADNQGNWIPSCPIIFVKKDGYYGWVGQNQKPEQFQTPDPPLCWIPYDRDRSSSGQVWVPEKDTRWGPFAGRMLVSSYDCWLSLVFFDKVQDSMQGGTFRFPFKFSTGMMRPRFNPADGQLYCAGLRGWSSSAAKEGALQRVRYTGKPVVMPVEVHQLKTGLEMTFTGALDPATAKDGQNFSAEWFNVVRSATYGSPDYTVSDPKKKGREHLDIAGVSLDASGKVVTLTLPNLKPVTNLVIKYKLKSADGGEVNGEVDYTINRVP